MRNKLITLFSLSVMVIFTTSVVYAATIAPISYWYSDKEIISRWKTSRVVWTSMSDSSLASSTFSSYVSHATTQWANAGIYSNSTSNALNSNIRIYGGNYNTLKALAPSLSSSNTGLTIYSGGLTYEGEWQYGISFKEGTEIKNLVNVYVVTKSGKTANGYKKTHTHEFGHALGWRGHSSLSSDIMYSTASEITTLTNRDKNHLKQVY